MTSLPITVRLIIDCAAALHDVRARDIVSARRTQAVVWPRMLSAWCARQMTPLSLPEIGRRLGGRDHTTILHACRRVDGEMARPDPTGETARDQAAQLMAAVKARVTFADRPGGAALPVEADAGDVALRILEGAGPDSISLDDIMTLASEVVDLHRLSGLIDADHDLRDLRDVRAAAGAFVAATEQLARPLDPPARASLTTEQRRAYRDLRTAIQTPKETDDVI